MNEIGPDPCVPGSPGCGPAVPVLPAHPDPLTASKGLDSPLGRVMSRMLLCLCNALTAAGRPVCDCCTAWSASAPTMDMWCNCDCLTGPNAAGGGMAWVRLVRIDPLTRDIDKARCSPNQIQAIVESGVYRCWPSPDDNQPTGCQDARFPASMGLVTDTQLAWQAAWCCNQDNFASSMDDWEIQPNVMQPVSPQGGCAGTSVLSYVRGVLPGIPDLAARANAGP